MHINMNLFLLYLLNYIIAINAFNPLSISSSSSSNTATHGSITRCAIATVTNEYIQTGFGIQITPPTVENGICSSSFFTDLKAVFEQITNQVGTTYTDWILILDYIVSRNVLVDVAEQTDTSRHFDSESFIAASRIILARYQLAVQALNAFDHENANEYFGKMTHTLQDFYSHSNWIELNQREPQLDLGIRSMTSSQFAGPTVRTCYDCATGPTAVCQSNNDVTKGLTSGYFLLLVSIFNKKPVGKCSHGGTFDATKTKDAIGGINKDTPESIHGYLHQPAAQTAYLATCKTLRQFRTEVGDPAFGQFLNILPRQKFTSRSASLTVDPALVYTNILNNVRKANSFSLVQQIVSLPASDSYYRAHVLSIANSKHITIDIFRSSIYRQKNFDFGEDLTKATGGLYLLYYNQTEAYINTNEKTELIDLLYSKQTSDQISIPIDLTCSNLFLELITNESIPSLTIQLKNANQILSPSSIVTNTAYYKSYRFSNISHGVWKMIFTSSKKFTFDLRVSCSSKFRCFSRVYVNNDNAVHPGLVELQGNLIESQTAFLITTCDDQQIPVNDMRVTVVDDINGKTLGNSVQSIYDQNNDRWITNLTKIPSKSFRLKFSINNQQIQRLSHASYQPSLVDVEITEINTTSISNTIIKYRLYNYHQKAITLNFIAKNIGAYFQSKTYSLKAKETRDDQIQFDQNTKSTGMTGNTLALTVSTSKTDWNYDITSM